MQCIDIGVVSDVGPDPYDRRLRQATISSLSPFGGALSFSRYTGDYR